MCFMYKMLLVVSFMDFDAGIWNAGWDAVPCGDCAIQWRFFELGVVVSWDGKFS